MERKTKKLIQACIKKYDLITKEVEKNMPENLVDLTLEQTKKILLIDGMEFYYFFGRIKDTYSELYGETHENE